MTKNVVTLYMYYRKKSEWLKTAATKLNNQSTFQVHILWNKLNEFGLNDSNLQYVMESRWFGKLICFMLLPFLERVTWYEVIWLNISLYIDLFVDW